MVMRKKTLRRLSPVARKVARFAGEADSVGRRLKNLVEEIANLEMELRAAQAQATFWKTQCESLKSPMQEIFPDERDDGRYDIDYDCGCAAECRFEEGHPIWALTALCEEHDPTVKEKISQVKEG